MDIGIFVVDCTDNSESISVAGSWEVKQCAISSLVFAPFKTQSTDEVAETWHWLQHNGQKV